MLFTQSSLCFGGVEVKFSLRPSPSQEDLISAVAGSGSDDDCAPLSQNDDLTGLEVWAASRLLARYLSEHAALVKGKSVLELGAGVGIPGLLAARLGAAHVKLTDYDRHVLPLLRKNIDVNDVAGTCSAELLDWSDGEAVQGLGQYDVVLAADVAYVSRYAQPLASAMSSSVAAGGVVLMGHQTRKSVSLDRTTGQVVEDPSDEPLERFLEAARALGLHVKEVACAQQGQGQQQQQQEPQVQEQQGQGQQQQQAGGGSKVVVLALSRKQQLLDVS